MDNGKRFRIAVFLMLLVLAPGLIWAGINGSISGLVTDASGAVVSGASVTATNTQTGVQSKATTDAKGFYNFPSLLINLRRGDQSGWVQDLPPDRTGD